VADREVFSEINSRVHDEHFDLDQLIHDVDRAQVRLTIYPGQWTRHRFGMWTSKGPDYKDLPEPIGELVVSQVESVEIEDHAQIQYYTVNHLAFDADKHQVILESNIPLIIRMQVRELDVDFVMPGT
jgi:hypothetical protein